MRTLRLTLAYDGTRFVGWQRQRAGVSVQGLLEEALGRLEGRSVTVHGAGRTDAGVHALAQVASARVTSRLDPATLLRALNAHLPADVRVIEVQDVPAAFHARFSAREKTYRYQIATGAVASPFARAYAWHLPEPLDVARMERAAAALVGTHDFAAFQSTGSSVGTTVRTVARSDLLQAGGQPGVRHGSDSGAADDSGAETRLAAICGPLLVYEIAGTGFLRHMVRAIVGTLVAIGHRRWPVEHMDHLLGGGRRAEAGVTAPPHGLFLVRVDYH